EFEEGAKARQIPLRTAAFEGKLRANLSPTVAFTANEARSGDEHIVEKDLVEVTFTREIGNRPHGQPWALHVDKELTQTRMPLAGVSGANQRNHEVGIVSV